MPAYRVLVSHRDLKMKTVVHLDHDQQVQYLVDAGYLKPMEEVREVEGTGVRDVDPDPVAADVPRRRRKTVTAEVSDEPDRAVSDGDPADSQG